MQARQFNLSKYQYHTSADQAHVIFVNVDQPLKDECERLGIELGGQYLNTLTLSAFKQLRSAQFSFKEIDLFKHLETAIEYVWKHHLRHSFKKDEIFWQVPDNFMFAQGKEVPRPNHGIVHTLNVVALLPVIAVFYKTHSDPDCHKILDALDERKLLFLQLAALFSVVGRKDETGFGTQLVDSITGKTAKEIYLQYRDTSAAAFNDYCRAHMQQLGMTEVELFYYTEVVRKMGNPQRIMYCSELIAEKSKELKAQTIAGQSATYNEEPLFDYTMLHLAHCLNLFRCADSMRMTDVLETKSSLFKQFLVGDYQQELDKLFGYAISLSEHCSDRLLSTYLDGKFIDVSKPWGKNYATIATNPGLVMNIIKICFRQEMQIVDADLRDEALARLLHGPRRKNQATIDLEEICKAFLSATQIVKCNVNILGELEVVVDDVIYNLSLILKDADFEQIEWHDEVEKEDKKMADEKYSKAYAEFLKLEWPKLPQEKDYREHDPTDIHQHLSYGEKLAITLYTSEALYNRINYFLRNDGKISRQSSPELTRYVKHMVLLSVMATTGLSKVAAHIPTGEFNPVPQFATLYRDEDLSTFHEQRLKAMREKRVILQKGFTSTSQMLRRPKAITIKLEQPMGPMPLGINIKELSIFNSENESLFPPSTEYLYYRYKNAGFEEVLTGMPVRTIERESEYRYGTKKLRNLRHKVVQFIQRLIIDETQQTYDAVEYIQDLALRYFIKGECEYNFGAKGLQDLKQKVGLFVQSKSAHIPDYLNGLQGILLTLLERLEQYLAALQVSEEELEYLQDVFTFLWPTAVVDQDLALVFPILPLGSSSLGAISTTALDAISTSPSDAISTVQYLLSKHSLFAKQDSAFIQLAGLASQTAISTVLDSKMGKFAEGSLMAKFAKEGSLGSFFAHSTIQKSKLLEKFISQKPDWFNKNIISPSLFKPPTQEFSQDDGDLYSDDIDDSSINHGDLYFEKYKGC